MRATLISVFAAAVLAACENGQVVAPNPPDVAVQRVVANAFQDQPFDTGSVTVLTAEHGELHSYTLTSCGEDAVCAGHRRGTIVQTPDYAVVTGTHHGRTFYLSPGGDGWMKRNGELTPLAWEDPNPATVLAPTRFSEDEISSGAVDG